MDNVWAGFIPILVNIVHIKLLCQQRVPLNGDHGVLFPIDIFRINVDFWPIERRFAYLFCIGNAQAVQNFPYMLLGFLPYLWLADIFFPIPRIPFGKMVSYIFLHA